MGPNDWKTVGCSDRKGIIQPVNTVPLIFGVSFPGQMEEESRGELDNLDLPGKQPLRCR